MQRRHFLTLAAGLPALAQTRSKGAVEIPADLIDDKVRGGFLGQVIGDLNGLKHEMKYILEPGNVEQYTPSLPDGAWTDDDTDVEWPYIVEMERSKQVMIPYPRVAEVWKQHINRRIWCSHLYLRQILDIGVEPPLTGRLEINPWADFNLSGQFVSESWGLISPGMPQTAARIGSHYTHVSVDGEAVQAAQMMAAMIAAAFFTNDMEKILDAGAASVDSRSVMREIVTDVRRWWRENPRDWRVTRKLTKDKYCKFGGHDMRDRNGVWLNGASTIAALQYGDGDFVQTVRSAFNLGWDADNNAATSGTILGVMKGYKALKSQGWDIKDLYRNTSRDNMPDGETITSYSDRMVALARLNIAEHGGALTTLKGQTVYRIKTETAANVEPLADPKKQYTALRAELKRSIAKSVASGVNAQERARGAYLAICLDLAPELRQAHPKEWRQALDALKEYPRVLQVMFFEAPFPAGEAIRKKAVEAGLEKPAQSMKLWT
ncbi:MAG: ADP-ribosylglycohydrolase family protein [Acidobacteria bacterium]|nr:ADP-ribosylglycohydrolase family protein [Acidobacteriota bacterium]